MVKDMLVMVDHKPIAIKKAKYPERLRVLMLDEIQNVSKNLSYYVDYKTRKELRKRLHIICISN